MSAAITVAGLASEALSERLRREGLTLKTGPFVFRLRSPHRVVADGVAAMYGDHEVLATEAFADFEVCVHRGGGMHRFVRPQARFIFDGRPVFEPLPADHAFALMEWAMNWCISSHAHRFLIVHAAVIERHGRAAIFPAPPGSGKSTLCAGLVHSGWRLLSDELTLIDMRDGTIWPLARPVSLKNRSIDVIRRFAPRAQFGRVTRNTAKGDVAHMRVPTAHLHAVDVPARARWIVFPRFAAGAAADLDPHLRASALVELARNAFNFALHGTAGFDRLCELVRACDCFDFRYGDLKDAVSIFDTLAAA